MLASARRTSSGEGESTPPLSVLQRLRLPGRNSSNKAALPSPQRGFLAPFRRRTESVNTVMSANSASAEDVPALEDAPATDADVVAAAIAEQPNSLEWLQKDCPADVLPVVLAFCGPQQTAALSKTNKHWNSLIRREGTWRVLCEELYKVRYVLVINV